MFVGSGLSRWPRRRRHEMSSLSRTLGSWVRIPLSVCALLSCVFVILVALRRADHSSKESYRLCKKYYETEKEARPQQRAVEPLMNETCRM
jgi:hypothetical protein